LFLSRTESTIRSVQQICGISSTRSIQETSQTKQKQPTAKRFYGNAANNYPVREEDDFRMTRRENESAAKKHCSSLPTNVRHSSPMSNLNNCSFDEISNPNPNQLTTVMNNIAKLTDIFVEEMKVIHVKLDMISQRTEKLEELTAKLVADKSNVNNKFTDTSIPKGLSNIARSMYNSIPEENQWNFEAKFTSPCNQSVTMEVVRTVKDNTDGEFNADDIRKSCAKYFEGLKRKTKDQLKNMEKYEETKKNKGMRSRRKRLFDGRKKYLLDELEKKIWSGCDQNLMSDEEEGDDCFIKRSLPWRDETLTNLCRVLDERWANDEIAGSRLVAKSQRNGHHRPPPQTNGRQLVHHPKTN